MTKPNIAAGAVASRRLAEQIELAALRAAKARKDASAARARAAREAKLKAGLENAASAILAPLRALPKHNRASRLRRHIELKGPQCYGLRTVPDLETLRPFLHNFFTESDSVPAQSVTTTAEDAGIATVEPAPCPKPNPPP